MVERAKEDGSWDRAYEGQRAMTVPSDLAAALAAEAPALATSRSSTPVIDTQFFIE